MPAVPLEWYEIDRLLGTGGNGQVYLARTRKGHPRLAQGQEVALKVLEGHTQRTAEGRKRFEREAAAGMRVGHPNVAGVLYWDAGTGVPALTHLVMEYVPGQDLGQLLRGMSQVPEALCRHFAISIAHGLAAIHGAGLVHRDIKPSNLRLTPEGRLKILDLGVAAWAEPEQRLTQSGEFVGTYHYAAPEQLASARDVDGRADLYALGATLCELATGVRPPRGPPLDAFLADETLGLRDHGRPEAITSPPSGTRAISPFFRTVLRNLLYESPRQRIASADALVEILEQGEASAWYRELSAGARYAVPPSRRVLATDPPTALYGRDAALERLMVGWSTVREGRGSTVLVRAAAGLGKTRLMYAFLEALAEDEPAPLVLVGRHMPGRGDPGTSALVQAIGCAFEGGDVVGRMRAVLPAMPRLADRVAKAVLGELDPSESDRVSPTSFRTACIRLLQALAAERTLVLLLEDLHFGRAGALELLADLDASLHHHGALVVATSRPTLDAAMVAELRRRPSIEFLDLEPLDDDAMRRLLDERVGPQDAAHHEQVALFQRVQGSPFYLLEFLRSVGPEGLVTRPTPATARTARPEPAIPRALDEVLGARLSGLDTRHRSALQLSSCIGSSFDPAVFAEAATNTGSIGTSGLVDAVRLLEEIRVETALLRTVGDRYAFEHHLLYEVTYERVPPVVKQHLHSAIADAFAVQESKGGVTRSRAGGRAVERLHHLLCAGRMHEAVAHVEPAAAELGARFEHERLLAMLDKLVATLREAAVDVPPRVLQLQARSGHVLGILAQRSDVVDAYRRAAEASGDAAVRRDALKWEAVAASQRGELDVAISTYESIREDAEARGDEGAEARARLDIANTHLYAGEFDRARDELQHVRETAVRIGSRALAVSAMGSLAFLPPDAGLEEDPVELLNECVTHARKTGDLKLLATALDGLTYLFGATGRFEEAYGVGQEALEVSRRIGDREAEAIALLNMGVQLHDLGRLRASAKFLVAARKVFEEIAEVHGAFAARVNLTSTLLLTGPCDGIHDELDQLDEIAESLDDRRPRAYARRARGRLLHREGRVGEAIEVLRVAVEEDADKEESLLSLLLWSDLELERGGERKARELLGEARRRHGNQHMDALEALVLAKLCVLDAAMTSEARTAYARVGGRLRRHEHLEAAWTMWLATRDHTYHEEAVEDLEVLWKGMEPAIRLDAVHAHPLWKQMAPEAPFVAQAAPLDPDP